MYKDLGGFPLNAVADPTGRNPFGSGYSTILLNADTSFRTSLPLVECYHMWVNSQVGSAFVIWRNMMMWDYVIVGNNAWDPAQPLPLRSGDTIYFYFNQPFQAQTTPSVQPNPSAVCWLREPTTLWAGLTPDQESSLPCLTTGP
jgi:hypothetical protein